MGRDAELAILTEAVVKAIHGSGSAWLIGGESGIGKSRLLEEVRTEALVRGALVLRGQAESSGSDAYGVWRDILRALCLQVELTPLGAGVLKPLLPDLAALLDEEVADAPKLDAQSARLRLLNTVESLILKLANQPTLLLFEDLH